MKSKCAVLSIFFVFSVEKCFSIVPDAERFSSSIVSSADDWQFGLPSRPPRHNRDEITRSYIDRDPIFFNDESDSTNDQDLDCVDDPLSHFYSRHNHNNNEQWQSPLERISPLPSSIQNSQDESPTIHNGTPITINSGWEHSHQIDVQQRNSNNQQQQYKIKTRSTGTTIAALLANNSKVLILAADTRATDDTTVADKRCEKLHALAKNVWCAGAGTSADVEAMVRRVKFTFWKRGVLNGRNVGIGNMGSGSDSRNYGSTTQLSSSEDDDVPISSVMAILHYLRTQLQKTRGALGVNLLVGGYEYGLGRAYLAAVHPHGSMDVVTYAALGSGGLAATGVLESRYPQVGCNECTVEEGIRLAVAAVTAGIDNDLGSGSQVDVCVISADGVMYRRAIVKEEELEWINDNDCWYDAARNRKENDSAGASGVNGFGNLPFSFQSKKIVVGGRLEAEREQRDWLDNVLHADN